MIIVLFSGLNNWNVWPYLCSLTFTDSQRRQSQQPCGDWPLLICPIITDFIGSWSSTGISDTVHKHMVIISLQRKFTSVSFLMNSNNIMLISWILLIWKRLFGFSLYSFPILLTDWQPDECLSLVCLQEAQADNRYFQITRYVLSF